MKCLIFIGYILTLLINTVENLSLDKIIHVYNIPPVDFSRANASKTDVTYQLFTNKTTTGTYLNEDSASKLINKEIPTKFLIHGWLSNETTYWYAPYRDASFKQSPCNVIYIDWSKAGAKDFPLSAANSKPIGGFIGDFIIAAKLKLENVHIVGHSLGAHVAGFIGKSIFENTASKVARITCTDAAGPGFEDARVGEENRVVKSDAEFVDAIHTDIGHYGFIQPFGHVDFYPNGGTHQPGCPSVEEDDNCSHARSNWYFIESVNSNAFLATPCTSWDDYINDNCDINQEKIIFGENIPQSARGVYYFKTNSQSPFALGK